MLRSYTFPVLVMVAVLIIHGCGKDSNPAQNEPVAIPNKLYDVKASDIQAINHFPEVTPFVDYDVSVYLLEYTTNHKGSQITVSGAIAIPQGISDPSIIVDCHGTLQSNSNAPTNSTAQKPLRFVQLAAAGYIVFAPDYIGFGEAVGVFHPWLLAQPAANAIIDMIVQGKQLLDENDVPYSDQFFLTGYSEGSNFVLAAQQMIESDAGLGINLTASAPSSGAYDMEMTFTRRIEGNDSAQAVGVAYLVLAMDDYYDWNFNLSGFFKEPYASAIADILQMTGSFEDNFFGTSNQLVTDFINGTLTPQSLLTDSFRNDPESDIRMAFDARLQENDVYRWRPVTPTTLYYGKDDTTTFFENSLNAYDEFISNGADQNDITLVGFDGRDHEEADSPSMAAALEWFGTF